MKAHLACGTIYLQNYVNVDAAPHYIVPDVPEEIFKTNTTNTDHYYKYDFCKGSGFCVADVKAKLDVLPFVDESVDEVILYQALEHIPIYNMEKVLKEINRILVKDGLFYLAVPDVKETAKLLANAKTIEDEDWCIRLIHGTQRNEWSHHFCGFVPRTLKDLLSKYGFGKFEELENLNFYPAIHMRAYKIG